MKFVALVSGGKDSIYAIWHCLQQGHELVAGVHLAAPAPGTSEESSKDDNDDDDMDESYMYQSAASNVVAQQMQSCLGVPCIVYPRRGTSRQISLVYDDDDDDNDPPEDPDSPPSTIATTTRAAAADNDDDYDEVQDLYEALKLVKKQFPELQAVCCGAMASTYQRVRVEHVVCRRMQWQSLSYLWRQCPADTLLHNMLFQDVRIHAILVKTASPPGLQPQRHLGRSLHELAAPTSSLSTAAAAAAASPSLFQQLHQKYGFHVCGEGGEYETLVLNVPGLFQRRLVLDQTRIRDKGDGVGILQIETFHTEANGDDDADAPAWVERVMQPNGQFTLRKKRATTNEKETEKAMDVQRTEDDLPASAPAPTTTAVDDGLSTTATVRKQESTNPFHSGTPNPTVHCLPHVRRLTGGFWSVSELTASTMATTSTRSRTALDDNFDDDDDDEVVRQALQIFATLQQILDALHCTPQDILMVHLYLPKMAHFALINQHYRQFFGVLLPPSRATVSTATTSSSSFSSSNGHRGRMVLDCYGQCGSGAFLRGGGGGTTARRAAAAHSTAPPLRQVLHVQSISYWAPVCVGPYSQVNTVRNALHFVAGQIGLQPATMTLVRRSSSSALSSQLEQCWTNVAAIVDAVNQIRLSQCAMSCLLYVTTMGLSEAGTDVWKQVQSICQEQWNCNGGIVPGAIDGTTTTTANHNGYEDEETRLALEGEDTTPTAAADVVAPMVALVVTVPELPVGAVTEVELVAATRPAVECLDVIDHHTHRALVRPSGLSSRWWDPSSVDTVGWDTGHDFAPDNNNNNKGQHSIDSVHVQSYVRSLGTTGEASFGLVAASAVNTSDNSINNSSTKKNVVVVDVDVAWVLRRMLEALRRTHLDVRNVLHVRLYYCVDTTNDHDNGTQLRLALQAAMGTIFDETCWPASTLVPVHGLRVCWLGDPTAADQCTQEKTNTTATTNNNVPPFLAMQAIALDPVHLEQSIWIRHGRNYS